MPGKGGWFKSYDDEIEDPKVEGLTDSEYRVWRSTLDLCNRSPARLRERGCLYHSKGFPVSAEYIARRLSKPLEEVEAALARLCQAGGESSLLMLEEGTGGPVYRIRAWRKRQLGSDEDQEDPRKIPERSQKDPEKIPKSSQEDPELSRPDVDVDVDVDLDIDNNGPSGGSAKSPPTAASTAEKPPVRRRKRAPILTPEQITLHRTAIEHYWYRLQEWTNTPKPQWTSKGGDDGGIAAKFFAEKVQQAEMDWSADDFRGIIDCFFDEYIQPKSAANFDHFVKVWNALLAMWAKPEVRARVEWRSNRRENAQRTSTAASDGSGGAAEGTPSPEGGGGGGESREEDGDGAAPDAAGEPPAAEDSPATPDGNAVPPVQAEDATPDEAVSEGAVSL